MLAKRSLLPGWVFHWSPLNQTPRCNSPLLQLFGTSPVQSLAWRKRDTALGTLLCLRSSMYAQFVCLFSWLHAEKDNKIIIIIITICWKPYYHILNVQERRISTLTSGPACHVGFDMNIERFVLLEHLGQIFWGCAPGQIANEDDDPWLF